MALEVYGIPNCGTCKKALKWLEAQGAEYVFINTKEAPPSKEAITGWVQALTAKPMRNTSGQAYRAIPAEQRDAMSDDDWIEAFTADAMLLKRPLFIKDGTAVKAGFRGKPEAIQATLNL